MIWRPRDPQAADYSPARIRRSVRSHYGAPIALRDDRWLLSPSLDIRYAQAVMNSGSASLRRRPGESARKADRLQVSAHAEPWRSSPRACEEPARGRDDPVASALALRNREPPVGDLHVGEPQAQHLA